jgi:hypothetical protein
MQQYDIWNVEAEPNNSDFFLRNSGRQVNRSNNYINFRDINDSRYSQQYNMNQSLFRTNSKDRQNLEDSARAPVLRSRIKPTSSFDEIFK